MPINIPSAVVPSASTAIEMHDLQATASPTSSIQVSAAQVNQAKQQAGEFMEKLENHTDGGPMPWIAAGSHGAGNYQSLVALTGLTRDLMMSQNQDSMHMSAPRDMVVSDLFKAGGATGLQLFSDVGAGFGWHLLLNSLMLTHNLVGEALPEASPSTVGNALNNTVNAVSLAHDVGSLFANSNALGFGAPSMISGSCAYVSQHGVKSLIDAPQTTGSPGSSRATRIAHEQVQNLLFNLPGMITGFSVANLALSAMKAPHPAVEWLLWSLGGGLGGALGSAMNLAYKCTVMGHKVVQPNRSWAEKTTQLKTLNVKEWSQFVVAHLASLSPIQYKGVASSALIPGSSYGQNLARRSANTMVLQGGFAALHGNVQKLVGGALDLAGKLGSFCQDKGHLCHPRGDSEKQASQITEHLLTGSRDLNDLAHNLEGLLGLLRDTPEKLGPLKEPLQKVENSLARMAALQYAPPAKNEEDKPTSGNDINRWHSLAATELRQALSDLSELVKPAEGATRQPALANSMV